jgi:hypothetical protein
MHHVFWEVAVCFIQALPSSEVCQDSSAES